MSPTLGRKCPQCHEYHQIPLTLKEQSQPQTITIISPLIFHCPQCANEWGKVKNPDDLFDYCPVCECRQFYLSKDFNQLQGCIIMFVGIILVPWTYGLSLPIFAFVDWLLYRRVPDIVNCYRCGTEFKEITPGKRFKPFLHHIGLKYDKFR